MRQELAALQRTWMIAELPLIGQADHETWRRSLEKPPVTRTDEGCVIVTLEMTSNLIITETISRVTKTR